MNDASALLQFLTVAPTPLLILVIVALWKIDRRLLKVETKLEIEET
jgi:hypothetical protein